MRKLNLERYTVSIRDAGGIIKQMPYEFKESLIELMFHSDLRLTGRALLETDIIVEKLMKADKEILLEEEEYNKIRNAINSFKGFARNEVELVKRITECPQIDVKENVKEKK